MDKKFLRTEQKNEHIMHTNYDMSHKNQNTYNLGEIKVSQYEPILPSDSAELRTNDEIICQPLENPAFSNYKLCHKTFYMPNTNLWKYWDNFITEKPDYTWTSSSIQQFIEENQPYTPPYFTWTDILPIVAFARGYVSDIRFAIYPIQDDQYQPYVIEQFNDGRTMFYTDLLNMGQNPVGDSFSSITNPRVIEDAEFWDVFGGSEQSLDATRPLSTGEVPLESNLKSFLARASDPAIHNNIFVWSNNETLDQADINQFRVVVTFSIKSRQSMQFDPFEYEVNGQYFTALKGEEISTYAQDVSPSYNGVKRVSRTVNTFGSGLFYCLPLPAAYESSQYRMSSLMYLWYLCRNACKLLDSLSIPVYTEELFNYEAKFDALPFFAYSRFYHEFMANKQLQVNAPDWSEANGPLCPRFDSYDSPSNHYTYGWILHHPELPYNVNTFTYDEKLIIRNFFQGTNLLLGLNLNSMLFSSNLDLDNFNAQMDRSNKSLSHTYMVYNGLLHLQYSNFPSDYFTEALLDPLAGAKDINIPSTITQLQEKSKLQDFLNQTAWTRNIKEWLQSQWDTFSKYTTVNEPSLCGSSDVDINISQVLQTSESANTPLGTRAGIGSGYGNGYLCKEQFGEYGVLMTISYIVLDTTYVNRLDVRQVHKSSRFDYPLPQFANLGNEAIHPYELNFQPSRVQSFGDSVYLSYVSDTAQVPGFKTLQTPRAIMNSYSQSAGQYLPDNATPQTVDLSTLHRVFGYIPRYSIYKHHMDEIHGDFLTTLKRWVPSRELNRHPTYLNYVFISYELASQTSNLLKNFVNTTPFGEDNFLVNHTNILHMRRALPYIVKPQL